MRTSTRIQIAVVALLLIAAGVVYLVIAKPFEKKEVASPSASNGVSVVAENSHRLDDAGPDAVVLTEFLDFECEACAAVHPYMEQVRKDYAGKITFVLRYFPLNGHPNSGPAALAAEAAARQGKLEVMYNKLFETQEEWSHKADSQADVFRGYAEGLGLDMAAYDAAIADPATEARVREDLDAATRFGLQGTPSIFVDNEPLQLTRLDDIRTALDKALAEKS
ncbi:protein-disulfide isomerase [Mycetocola sp. BIGb0189]|uniref:DsbA family protein n=1 Tax=Mycetocola sp. BIGb0189 TaxID=2940604 RepID=UPI0021676BE1|nr:DsbA family protein [Mycetocola sp. BIGb0189]MCS4275766.1 protein-disulfide isomerase [Mycetocola sp. BIGb0189]